MGKLLTLLLFLSLGISQIQAQTKIVSGTIFDETGSPLPGASILIKGTNSPYKLKIQMYWLFHLLDTLNGKFQ